MLALPLVNSAFNVDSPVSTVLNNEHTMVYDVNDDDDDDNFSLNPSHHRPSPLPLDCLYGYWTAQWFSF